MKKIILLRHAKSSWSDLALGDHERPLNARGKAAAPLIGAWLAERSHMPDRILCSSARRTQQTVKRIRKSIDGFPEPVIEPALYHAGPRTMLDLVRGLGPDCSTVMIVAHEPGLGEFLLQLSDGRERSQLARAYHHFPTAAAAVLVTEVTDWREVTNGTARLIDFAVPRELAGR